MRPHRAAVFLAAAIALVSGCTAAEPGTAVPGPSPSTTRSTPSPSTPAPGGACDYREDRSEPPARPVGLPTGNERVGASVALRTNQGEIKVTFGAATPCTVRSFVHLTEAKFFDDSPCHRLTGSEGLRVLQCGDPTGTGRSGPGYRVPDEFPTDLEPGKPAPDGRPTVIYPRGAVAMANTGAPNSGGSQFFLVYGDSTLFAAYSLFGTVDEAGLAVLDKIAAAGTEDGSPDGAPESPVTIQQTVVGS